MLNSVSVVFIASLPSIFIILIFVIGVWLLVKRMRSVAGLDDEHITPTYTPGGRV